MNEEPKLAVDAVLDTDEIVDNVTIHPLTCARYALLCKINSPLITNSEFEINSLIPTIFVMTQEFSELKKYVNDIDKLIEESYDACEDIDVKTFSKIVEKMLKTFDEINKLAPNASKDDKKKFQ